MTETQFTVRLNVYIIYSCTCHLDGCANSRKGYISSAEPEKPWKQYSITDRAQLHGITADLLQFQSCVNQKFYSPINPIHPPFQALSPPSVGPPSPFIIGYPLSLPTVCLSHLSPPHIVCLSSPTSAVAAGIFRLRRKLEVYISKVQTGTWDNGA